MKSVLFCLGVIFFSQAFSQSSYHRHEVWRLKISHSDDSSVLDDLLSASSLDVWSRNKYRTDVRIPPDRKDFVSSQLKKFGVEYDIMIHDVQTIIDSQVNANKPRRDSKAIAFDVYHTFEEIEAYMADLNVNSSLATLNSIGQTLEGRDMWEMTISTGTPKPSVWLDCGIHAREWISPATCLYGLDLLTSSYGTDPNVTRLLDAYDLYIVPVYNPDGYSYTWTDDRLWRKNRRINAGSNCTGVDLNRNFDDHWSFAGSSPDPCENTYHGESPASEMETQYSQGRFASLISTANLASIYSLHSYGQVWLYAYGWTNSPPPDVALLDAVASVGVEALTAVHGTIYDYNAIGLGGDPISSTTVDYGYYQGVPLSYVLELRDNGEYGFLLPEDQIIPNAEEVWAGLIAAILYM